jgi:hypothetical protein
MLFHKTQNCLTAANNHQPTLLVLYIYIYIYLYIYIFFTLIIRKLYQSGYRRRFASIVSHVILRPILAIFANFSRRRDGRHRFLSIVSHDRGLFRYIFAIYAKFLRRDAWRRFARIVFYVIIAFLVDLYRHLDIKRREFLSLVTSFVNNEAIKFCLLILGLVNQCTLFQVRLG